MKKTTVAAAIGLSLIFGSVGVAQAQALTPIKISYQPSLYWALPFHIATEKGWWKEVGLAPEFSTALGQSLHNGLGAEMPVADPHLPALGTLDQRVAQGFQAVGDGFQEPRAGFRRGVRQRRAGITGYQPGGRGTTQADLRDIQPGGRESAARPDSVPCPGVRDVTPDP